MRVVTTQQTTTTKTYTRLASISPDDQRMVLRLVGYYEYGNALNLLDELVASCSTEELEAIDQLVAERDEFTVYTDLGRRLQRGPSSLIPPASPTEKRGQRGLDWVMGLARIELAAMLAGFTSVPQPFEMLGPTPFDAKAYRALMHDGALSHYWSLVNDPMLEPVSRMSPLQVQVLAYSRRLVIARGLLRATMKAHRDEYNPIQLREISAWKEGLDALQAGFIAKIELFLQDAQQQKVSQKSDQGEYVKACIYLLKAEQRELQAGRATKY